MDEKRRMVLDLFDGGEGGQSGGEAAGGTGAGETVVYGKQEETAPQDGGHGEGEPELDIPAEDGSPVTSDALEAKKREFRKLIGGEYKDLYQQEVSRALDQRFRKNRGLEAKLGEYQPLIDLMMDRYGVANGDLGQLQRAIESDETYWEAAAEDAGMSTEQYKAFAQMKRENGQMRQALEQRQRQQSVEAQLQRWYSQAEEARQAYPDLDLERESQDPRFLGMLKAGVPVQHA